MKKRSLAIALLIALLGPQTLKAAEAAPPPADREIQVFYNYYPVEFPERKPVQDENNRVLVPVRAISEALDSKVTWDEEKKEVVITGTNPYTQSPIRLVFIEGRQDYYINGERFEMDTQAAIVDGSIMVPVRYVDQAFDSTVKWSEAAKSVYMRVRDYKFDYSDGKQYYDYFDPAVFYDSPQETPVFDVVFPTYIPKTFNSDSPGYIAESILQNVFLGYGRGYNRKQDVSTSLPSSQLLIAGYIPELWDDHTQAADEYMNKFGYSCRYVDTDVNIYEVEDIDVTCRIQQCQYVKISNEELSSVQYSIFCASFMYQDILYRIRFSDFDEYDEAAYQEAVTESLKMIESMLKQEVK